MCDYCQYDKDARKIMGDGSCYIYIDKDLKDMNLVVDGDIYDFATISYCPMCGRELV